jgi:hypothetical protein
MSTSAYINIYMEDPTNNITVTAGGTDGVALSTEDTYTSPLSITLDAATSESKIVKLAVRCEPNFTTEGTTTISDYNDTNDRWKLCLTENGTYTDYIEISSVIGSTNVIFYAKASSVSTEGPQKDRNSKFRITTKIVSL